MSRIDALSHEPDPSPEDDYDGYDRNDPKHPTYRDRLLRAAEMKGPQ